MVVDLSRRRYLEIYSEVHGIAESETGKQNRRTDIIVLDRIKDKGPIFDQTIK